MLIVIDPAHKDLVQRNSTVPGSTTDLSIRWSLESSLCYEEIKLGYCKNAFKIYDSVVLISPSTSSIKYA